MITGGSSMMRLMKIPFDDKPANDGAIAISGAGINFGHRGSELGDAV